MSSAARFLLEFEATGDQEVVSKIREVGAAGKETAADLQQLQGIQDPFEPVASGAEAAIAPVENVGTAVTDTAGTMTELTTEGEAAGTGMTEFGASTEEAASSTEGFGSSVETMSGSLAAIGGTIGSVVSSLFRYNDIQLKVQKAQLTSARATEQSRKAEEGLDKVLATATSNTANIAAARDRLAKAQTNMNKLMDQGVTSGAAFEAAQNEVTAAQKSLSAEFAKGGGDISKLTAAMEKSEINSNKMVVSLNNLEKTNREAQQSTLELAFGFTGMAGSIVQSIGSFGKLKTAASGIKAALTALPFAATSLGLKGIATTIGSVLIPALGAAYAGFIVFEALPTLIKSVTAQINGDLKETAQQALNMFEILEKASSIDLGPLGKVPLPFTEALHTFLPQLREYLKGLGDVKGANIETGDSFFDLEGRFTSGIKRWNELIGATNAGTAATGNAVVAANDMVNAAGTEEKVLQSTAKATAQASADLDTLRLSSDNAAVAFGGVTDRVDGFNLRMGEHSQTVEQAKGTLAGYIGAMDFLNDAVDASTVTTQNAVVANGQLANVQGETTRAVKNGAIAFNELVNHAHAGGEAIRVYSTEADNAVDPSASLDDEVRLLGEDLDESGAKAQETAHELLTLADSAKNAQEAIDQNHLAFAQSVDALADMNTVMSDSTAHFEAVETAVNNTTKALLDEQIKLEAAAQSAGSAEQAQLRLANAYKSGVVEIAEWRNGLEEAKAAQQGQIAQLASIGATFEELERQSAGTLPPTIENLKLMGAAFGGSAQDAQAWRDALSESFATVQEAGNQMVNDLSDALVKGGEDLDDITDKWLEDMPEMFRERLDESQIVAMEGMAELQAIAKANKFELEADLKTESLDKARSDFIDNLEQMKDEADPKFQEIYDSAIEIAENGTADQMHRVAEILESDDPYPLMLENLKAIKLEQEGQRMGKELMNAYAAAIKGNSGLVGSAVLAASAAANVVPAGEKIIKPGAAAKIDVDDTAAKTKIQAIANALDLLNSTTVIPKVDIDAAAAASKVQATANALNILNQTTAIPKVDVDAKTAASKIQATTSALQILHKATVTPKIDVNATAAANKIAATARALNILNRTTVIPKIDVNAKAAASKIAATARALNILHRTTVTPKITINNSQAMSAISRVKSALSGLKNISRTITYTYRIVGRRPAQFGMHENLAEDTMIAAHKGERVDITPNAAGVGTIEQPGISRTIYSESGGRRGGGNEIVIPVTLMLDNKVLIRTVRRGLVEEVSGTM